MDLNIIKIGIVENLRYYLGTDFIYARMFSIESKIERNKIIKRMMRDYNIIRGFPDSQQDFAIDFIIDEFSKIDPKSNIILKSNKLDKIAKRLKENNFSHVNANSAASKLYWFYNPDNWMMYDRFALRGLKKSCPNVFKSEKQKLNNDFLSFYSSLDHLEISSTFELIRNDIEASHTIFSGLSGERIVDKILMYSGHNKNESVINNFEHNYVIELFQSKIDPDFNQHLNKIAERIEHSLSKSLLFQSFHPT